MSSVTAQEPRRRRGSLVGRAVFALDARLQRREGVYEYSSDPDCLFRIQRSAATRYLEFRDGTRLPPGTPLLKLHLWNEQMPARPRKGSAVAWAREIGHRIDGSLRKLAAHLEADRELDDICAVCADMRLGTAQENRQIARLAGRYGFEDVPGEEVGQARGLRRAGENCLGFLLVLASNPAAARLSVLRRDSAVVYLSRTTLERRYRSGVADAPPEGAGR